MFFMRCEKITTILFASLLLSGVAKSNVVDDSEKIRKRLFAGAEDKAACSILSRGPYVNLKETDSGLEKFVGDFLAKLKEKDSKITPFFHERLRLKDDFGDKLFSSLKVTYKQPWDFSIFRVFALNSPHGDKSDINCPEDNVVVTTAYGYPLQLGVWVQLLSQSELGRILAMVAPTKSGWRVVGLHMQQWTQNGKDYEAWRQESSGYRAKGNEPLAYLSSDVSQKMLFGGTFLTFPVVTEIIAERDAVMTKENLRKRIGALLPDRDIPYAGTVLAEDGPGWLIRERLTQDQPTNELMRRCLAAGKKLISDGWITKDWGGINCNFLLPGEPAENPGKLGGFYFSQKDILSKSL
jgi:hypothetical protein